MFWHLLPAQVTVGQVYWQPPSSTEIWMDKKRFFNEKSGTNLPQQAVLDVETKSIREQTLIQFCTPFVSDEFDLADSVQTKAAFSYVIVVMDRVDGWIVEDEKGSQIEARFATCMCVHNKAVICNGQHHMVAFRMNNIELNYGSNQLGSCILSRHLQFWRH